MAFRDPIPGLFQIGDLFGVAFDADAQLLQLQILLVQGQLELVGIVGEQDLTFGDVVTFPDQQLTDDLVAVLVDFGYIFGYHDAAETVAGGDAAVTGQGLYRLYVDTAVFIAAAGQTQQAQRQYQSNILSDFHRTYLHFGHFSLSSIIEKSPEKSNESEIKNL